MFPWEKKTQTNFYPRNDNRYPSVERKHNISVAADTRDYHNHFLPPIHNPNNISQYEDLSYHTPSKYNYLSKSSYFNILVVLYFFSSIKSHRTEVEIIS